MLVLCLCFISAGMALAQSQTSYYISNTGNDNNPGTRLKPFRTIQKLNYIKLKPGSKVYLAGNETFKGPLLLSSDESGTKAQPILITSYGKGVATINGRFEFAILVNSSYTILRNLKVKGAGRKGGNTTDGIRISFTNGNLVQDVTIEGFQKSGLFVYQCSNTEIIKVTARDNGQSGIEVAGTRDTSKNILIKDCLAENNPGDPTNFTNHSGNGILVGGSDHVVIDHCVATNNGWDMPRLGNGPIGIWGYESNDLVIQYCISYNNKTQGGASDGGGFDLDGGTTNSVIQYCLSYDNEGSGYGLFQYEGASPWSNNTIRYCISIDDGIKTEGAGGFLVWSTVVGGVGLRNCQVYNNVVYNRYAAAVAFNVSSKIENFLFANNIFVGQNMIVKGLPSGEKFLGNIWWGIDGVPLNFRGFGNLAEWAKNTGQETINAEQKGRQTDPLLKGPFTTKLTDPYQLKSLTGYQLQDNSPLIDSGLDLDTMFRIKPAATDFYGKPVLKGKAPDPGIDEN
jgi:hypothetical protein